MLPCTRESPGPTVHTHKKSSLPNGSFTGAEVRGFLAIIIGLCNHLLRNRRFIAELLFSTQTARHRSVAFLLSGKHIIGCTIKETGQLSPCMPYENRNKSHAWLPPPPERIREKHLCLTVLLPRLVWRNSSFDWSINIMSRAEQVTIPVNFSSGQGNMHGMIRLLSGSHCAAKNKSQQC